MKKQNYNYNGYSYPKQEKAKLSTFSIVFLSVIGFLLVTVIIIAVGISSSKKKAEKEGSTVYEQIAETNTKDMIPLTETVTQFIENSSNLQLQITVAGTDGNDAYFLGKLAPYFKSTYFSVIGILTDQYFEGWIVVDFDNNTMETSDYSNYTGELKLSYDPTAFTTPVYFFIDETGTYVAPKHIFDHIDPLNNGNYGFEHCHMFTEGDMFRIDDGMSGETIKADLIESFSQIYPSDRVVEAKTSSGYDAIDIENGGLSHITGSQTKDVFGNFHGNCELYVQNTNRAIAGRECNALYLRGIGSDFNFSIEFCDDVRFIGNKEPINALSMDEYLEKVKNLNTKYGVTPIQ